MASLHVPTLASGAFAPSIRYLDTVAAYDHWAEVYDTDGNFLQALDTIQMRTLLPKSLSEIRALQPWKLVDLGCGTGRNTAALLQVPEADVVGLDASSKMLEVAGSRLGKEATENPDSNLNRARRLQLLVYDLIQDSRLPDIASSADAVISTLVLEHVPIASFFRAASIILKPGGVFLVTNMHSEMGGISQAGFVDPKTGDKIRPKSYVYRLEDVLTEAESAGFEPLGEVDEQSVDEAMSAKLGPRAKKWIGVTVWFGVIFRKVE